MVNIIIRFINLIKYCIIVKNKFKIQKIKKIYLFNIRFKEKVKDFLYLF